MNTSTTEFLSTNAVEGDLSAEQAAQLIELAMGDTGAQPDNGGVPSATPAPVQPTPATESNQPTPETDPANAVVMAKDGVHTIPYEKLTEAREGERHWKAQAQQAQQELERMQAQAQQRVDAGVAPTQADQNLAIAEQALEQGISPDLFGDFSEEAIAAGVASLVDQRVTAALAKHLAPLQQQQKQQAQQTAEQAHFASIYEKHPDADSIGESQELNSWIAGKPSYEQRAINAVLDGGTATEVVELLDSFKRETGRAQPTAERLQEAARAALAGAKAPAPASLSDFPSAPAAPSNRFASVAAMSPADMADAMQNMTPDQIETFLNRAL